MSDRSQYVLVTPAKNEEAVIGVTIDCVVGQSVHPLEWVIVSDGSTDRTDEIVQRASEKHKWIKLLALPPRVQRNFGEVVRATRAGVEALSEHDYTFIGLLDSDLRLTSDYFERVIEEFAASPSLGLAGGMVVDVGLSKSNLPRNRQDVPGAVQFYRRTCFEAIKGLLPVPEGGWDGLACAQARMKGFETRLLTGLVVDHLKPRNASEGGMLRRHWQMGVRDYAVGYHPIFELFKCLSRLREYPLLIGASAWWVGYCCAAVQGRKRMIPEDVLVFLRREQKRRLWASFLRKKKCASP